MNWPWEFFQLNKPEKHERRLSLDRYGTHAQLSTLLPIAVFLIFRFLRWLPRRLAIQKASYKAVPKTPVVKRRRQIFSGSGAATARRLAWWLEDEVKFAGRNWGSRDQLIFGSAWTVWLLVLCIAGTGKDYFHLTKRFGIIAASQFPTQYLLSLKSLNPVAYAFRSSHEHVNKWHRVLGRITYFLLCLHGIFYINYYIWSGSLGEKLFNFVVAIGIFALIGMTLLTTTSLSVVRQYSYRVFFITHLLVALAIPPAIFFHVRHARVYMIESLLVFIADLVSRKLDTVTAPSTVEMVPGTSLIKIVAKVPQEKATRFHDHPGSHVYMNVPAVARFDPNPLSMAHNQFEFIFTPFTVAFVDEAAGELTLVARRMSGPMTQTLARHASAREADTKVPLYIEGPYGVSSHLSILAGPDFDRILLFAGGVGATYIMPIYQYILSENSTAGIELVWAVREAGEAMWPVSAKGKSIIDDGRIRLFHTGNVLDHSSTEAGSRSPDGEIEMSQMHRDSQRSKLISDDNCRRPDVQKIVNDVFRQGPEERIAVLVCGPEGMAREVRECVGAWVKKGRSVWWHNEHFGW